MQYRMENDVPAAAIPGGARGGSWPFGGDAGALPPMEVRRFRWWRDEAAAVEEEEAEVERRLAAKRRKRSVAELFAAVPRVPRGGQGRGKGKAAKRKAEKDKGKQVDGRCNALYLWSGIDPSRDLFLLVGLNTGSEH